jgi:hypothetical protein
MQSTEKTTVVHYQYRVLWYVLRRLRIGTYCFPNDLPGYRPTARDFFVVLTENERLSAVKLKLGGHRWRQQRRRLSSFLNKLLESH